MDDLIGQTLGQYQILELLGKGGMASVYKAYQPALQRYVALKVLPPHLAQSPEFTIRFRREARAIARLDHPNVVPVYDFGQANGITYIVMKYVDGGTLKDLLERQGKLPFEQAALILSQVASALDYAHAQGVIHRDIKPANVLMARPDWALLSDFGLVKVAEGSMKLTGTGVGLGTPEYMAPEQAHGLETDARTDIYSLGVMLYAMVTGEAPYTGSTPIAVILKHVNEPLPSPRAANPELPPAAESAILKAMAKSPDDRPLSASELSRSFSLAIGARARVEAAPVEGPALSLSKGPSVYDAEKDRAKAEPPAPALRALVSARGRAPLLLLGAGVVAALAVGIVILLGGRGGAAPAATPTTPPSEATPAATQPPDTALRLPINSTVQIWALQASDGELVRAWSGSGSIVSEDGLILTNAHVVLPDKVYGDIGALEVSLTIDDDQPPQPAFLAETVVADPDLDIAVIKIVSTVNGNPVDADILRNLPVVELGDSDRLALGDELFILGYPGIGGENITMTNGRVAGFTNEPGLKGRAYIKTNATIAGGNSGGLAADADGNLVGIPTQLGYGGDDQYIDCRVLADTNGDGEINSDDGCVPTGGFINALRPINLALPLLQQAQAGIVSLPTREPGRAPIELPANAGEALFADDFSDEASGWSVGDEDATAIGYRNGQIVIDVHEANFVGWTNPDLFFDALDIEVDVQRLAGPADNEMGIIFRYQDTDNFYVFSISSDGFYEFSKRSDGEWIFLLPWSQTDLIDQVGDLNRIAVVAEGDRFTFFVNGVQVDQTIDDTFASGDIGLLAGAFGEGGVSVGFDNVLVRVPGGPRQASAPGITPSLGEELVVFDDFDSGPGDWFAEPSDEVRRGTQEGEFAIEVVPPEYAGWSDLADLDLADVIVEVDAHKASGPDLNAFGILCRYLDADNFYALEIGSDGTYAIYRYVDAQYTALVDWTASEAIATGSEANHLRAECVGDHIRLYANGALLADVVDDALGSGSVALVAETFDEGGVQILFDNAAVSVPAAQAAAQALFSDDFSSPDSGWDRVADKETRTDYEDSRYVIEVNTTNLYVWANPGRSFGDVVIDVDTYQLEGPDDNDYGVLCRYQDVDNFYRILISGDGYYIFLEEQNGESTQLIDWTRSSAINQGAVSNHLTVTCQGDTLALWVNGEFVAETTDDTFGDGDIGLTAGAFGEPGVRVAFDNLVVTAP